MSELASKLLEYGILGMVVLAMGYAIRWMLIRLFGEDKGIITQVAARQVKFIDDLTQIMNTLVVAQKEMAEHIKHFDSDFRKVRTSVDHHVEAADEYLAHWQRVVQKCCDVARTWARKSSPEMYEEINRHISEIEQLVR